MSQDESELTAKLFCQLEPKLKPELAEEEVYSYDAPLAHIAFEELPKLEDFFGNNIPYNLLKAIYRLIVPASALKAGGWLNRSYLLCGPEGIDLGTVAQLLARSVGFEIVYARGSYFRGTYKASGKQKLEAFFAQAKKVREQTGKRVAIIIDELSSGVAPKPEPRAAGCTEDVCRSYRALITILDQHRYDSDIFFLGTTHYPEDIDPAIMRRFITIEVPKPAANFSLSGSMNQLKNAILSWFKRAS